MRLAITLLAALMPLLAADTITLRDGTRHYGTFVGSSGRTITFDEESGARPLVILSPASSAIQVRTVSGRVPAALTAFQGRARAATALK